MEEEEGARRGGGWTEEEEGAEEEGKKAGNRGERRASTADSAAPPGPRTPPEPGARAGTLQKPQTWLPLPAPEGLVAQEGAHSLWHSLLELGWGQVGAAFGASRLTATAPAGDPGQR